MSLFGSRSDEKRAAAIRRLKDLARALFDCSEDDAVVVNELACTEPGCPPLETVVAVLAAGRPARQVKLHKPALEITDDDLREAIGRAAGTPERSSGG